MPYRAPGADDPRQDWILRQITEAQNTLDRAAAEAAALPDSNLTKSHRIIRYNQLKREVDNSFSDLTASTRIWADRDITSLYQSGWLVGVGQTGVGMDFTLPHREALDILSYDAFDDVATRLQQVNQGFADTVDLQELYEGLSVEDMAAIQTKSRDVISQALLTGEADPKKVARRLAQDLWEDNPKLQIVDAGGKRWQMKNYTRMLVRTKSANAYNSGTLNKFAEEGVRRVQVYDGVEDEACAKANGEKWSLRYAMTNVIAHPNCVRAFSAIPGQGEVNRDTERNAIVAFDRAELGIGAIAALRHYNRSGEINVSSTLARLAWELVEAGTFPMPVLDEFIQGAAHLGLRELDGWIESYIDPVLYHAGLIRHMPTRAQLRKMNRPEQVLDRVAEAMRAANQEAFGTDYHPRVRQVTDAIVRAEGHIEQGVMSFKTAATAHAGGLRWIAPISQFVDVNYYGQLTAETLIRVRDGDTGLREAARAATFVLDQFHELKRLQVRAINASHDELMSLYDELDRISTVAAGVLADEISPDDVPEFFVDVLKRYSLTTTDLRDAEFAQRRLATLLNEVRETQLRVIRRIEDFEGTARNRQLAMAVSSGEDFPTHSLDMWDEAAFAETGDRLVGNLTSEIPAFDRKGFTDMQTFWRYVQNNPDSDLAGDLIDYQRAVGRWPSRLDNLLGDLDPYDPADTREAFFRVWRSLRFDSDGKLILESQRFKIKPTAVVGDLAEAVGDVMDLIPARFWYEGHAQYRKFIFDEMPVGFMLAAANAVPDTPISASILQNRYIKILDEVHSGQAGDQRTVTFDNLGEWLKGVYGESNVRTLGQTGINGEVYSVWDEITGQQFIVKKVNPWAMHTSDHGAIMSYVLTDWAAKQVDHLAVPPSRVVSVNQAEMIVLQPFVDEAEMWQFLDPLFDIEYDSARRVSFFDMITGEADAHDGNILMDTWSSGSGEVIIDREMSFGFFTEGHRFNWEQRDHALEIMEFKLGESWTSAQDLVGRTDRPTILRKITDAEFESLTGRTTFDPQDANNTPIIFDVNGHAFPLSYDDAGDVVIPYGRVGYMAGRHGGDRFKVSVFPTDSELKLVQRILEGGDELRAEMEQALISGLGDIMEGATVRTNLDDAWGLAEHATPEFPGVGGAVDYALSALQSRVAQLVDGGVINLAGPKSTYVNPNGDIFRIGDSMIVTDLAGETHAGTVFNIFEDTQGNTRIHWLEGVGLNLSKDEIPASITVETFDPDTLTSAREVLQDVGDRLRHSAKVIEDFPIVTQIDEVDLTPTARKVLKTDELGLPVGFDESVVQIEYAGDVNDAVRVVNEAGESASIPGRLLVAAGTVDDIVEEELSRVPAEFRPSKILMHLNTVETNDGKIAFGYFDTATGELHVSFAEAFDFEQVRMPDGTWALRVPSDGPFKYADVADNMDWERYREVLRHEISHSVREAVVQQRRAAITQQVLDEIVGEFPQTTARRDLNEIAKGLLPADVDLARFDDEFAALVATRVDLMEDVVNTDQWVYAMQMLEDAGDNIPGWAKRAYAGIARGDEDALDEFFAELWVRVAAAGGGQKGRRVVERQLGTRRPISRLLNMPVPEFPPTWNVGTVDFQIWLTDVLPDATRIVPKPRSNARVLWRRINIDLRKVADDAAEGFTVDLDGITPTSGNSVALRQFETVIEPGTVDEVGLEEELNLFFRKHRKLIEDHPELRYGGWMDDEGRLYLDIVRIFDEEMDAANFGFVEHQRAMYSFDKGRTIGLMDDEPDFVSWVARHYPDDPLEEYLAKERRVGAVRTRRTVNKQPVLESITDEAGEYKPVGLDAFDEAAQDKILGSLDEYYFEPTADEIADLKELNTQQLREKARKLGIDGYSKMTKDTLVTEVAFESVKPEVTRDAIKRRLIHVLETFEKLNKTSPPEHLINYSTGQEFKDLRGKYRFYTHWRDELVDVSKETGIPAPWIIAGGARMSAGLDADANLWIARFMAQSIAENSGLGHKLTAAESLEVRKWMGRSLDEGQAKRYLKDFKKPERADGFVTMSKTVKAGRYLNDYDPVTATYIVHVLTIINSQGLGPTGKGYSMATQYGFPQFQLALQGMQGRLTIEEVLGDSKVRSFHNNIIDPENIAGVGDVTTDFHMTDMGIGGIGKPRAKYKGEEPKIQGVGAGLRAVIGDIVRELFDEGWGERLGANTPNELQEILWGMWRDGKNWDLWGDLRLIVKRKKK